MAVTSIHDATETTIATGRRCNLIELSEAELTQLVQPLFPGRSLAGFELITEGRINTNYKVTVTGMDTPFLVRIYARDPDACQRELAISNLVKATVPVPEVLYACPQDSPIGKPYCIVKWAEGVTLQSVMDTDDMLDVCFHEVGESLAALSRYQFEQAGFFGADLEIKQAFSDDPAAYIRECLNNPLVQERLGAELYEALSLCVNEYGSDLAAVDDTPCLVHGDFNARNILVARNQKDGEWHMSAIIDWEFAHAGTQLFDIGNMLRYEKKYRDLQSRFIAGYSISYSVAGGRLAENWKQKSMFIDLNSLLEFLVGSDERQWLFDEVKQIIANTVTQCSHVM